MGEMVVAILSKDRVISPYLGGTYVKQLLGVNDSCHVLSPNLLTSLLLRTFATKYKCNEYIRGEHSICIEFSRNPRITAGEQSSKPCVFAVYGGIILPRYNIGTSESSGDQFTLVKLEFTSTSTQIKKLRYRLL